VKIARAFGAIVLAIVLQTTLARLLVGGTVALDLVLAVVVYVALTSGPATGLLAGAVAGLAQDALTSGIIGIGGLANTVVGYVIGVIGTQFIVAKPIPRFVVFVGATILHAVIFMGSYELLGVRHFGFPYAGVLSQAAANGAAGVVLFQAIEMLPGFLERRAATRGRMHVRRRLD
jgi:rod shape-determining protein MreD